MKSTYWYKKNNRDGGAAYTTAPRRVRLHDDDEDEYDETARGHRVFASVLPLDAGVQLSGR